MADFVEISAAEMDPSWITYERGTPGTLAHRLGGCWWCRRCFATSVDRDHICSDIVSGGRRWVRANLLPELTGEATSKGSINPTATDVLGKIDMVLEDYVTWHGSDDSADSEADDLEHGDWIPRIVYEPWAVSGDLPGPEDVPEQLHDDPQWAVYGIGSDDGDIEVWHDGLTLSEAEELA